MSSSELRHGTLARDQLWGELQTSVISGSNCWGEAFGLDSSDVFASMYQEESTIFAVPARHAQLQQAECTRSVDHV